ncbi:MAG: IctB family putative bicarbonate transporter [Snowella sp.]|nr:IctB family putative bicarbonate transporter [Snowella sp.]
MIAGLKQVMLTNFSPSQWRQSSYLYQLVGMFGHWREGSYLMQWSEAIAALLISLVYIVGPFTSTSLIGVLLSILGLYWGLLTVADTRNNSGITPIHLLVFLYWGISAVAVSFSPVKMAALVGFGKLSLNLFLFLIAARVLRSPVFLNRLITVILLVGLIVSSYGIRQQIDGVEQLATWNDPTSEMAGATRVYSYLGNPNLLAAYLLPILAFSIAALFVWRRGLPKVLAGIMVIINVACIYFTQSRGGWLGMVGVLAAFLILSYLWWRDSLPPFWQRWLLPISFGGVGILFILGLLLVAPLRMRVLSLFAGRADSSNNFRINVWEGVKSMIRDRPILGIGPGNTAFNKIYPLYMRPKYSALSAYSVYLEILVETGFIGFICFMWLLLVTISHGVRQIIALRQSLNLQGFWVIATLSGMAGLLVNGIADTVWYRPQVSTLWWLLIAIIASQYSYLAKKTPIATTEV